MAQTPEEKEAAKAAKEAEKEAAKAEMADDITVTWQGGSRVYSKAVHGDKRMEYAEEFAGKVNGTIA